MTELLSRDDLVSPVSVHAVLARSILADGLDLVLDLDRSAGAHLVDARDGKRYLDMFTFFASSALGMNHPALADDEQFRAELLQAAVNKPSNSDVYTVPMARFVETFARVLATRPCRTCSSSTAAPWPWRTPSRSLSIGRAGTTRHAVSIPSWAPGCCICAAPSTAAAVTRCR